MYSCFFLQGKSSSRNPRKSPLQIAQWVAVIAVVVQNRKKKFFWYTELYCNSGP